MQKRTLIRALAGAALSASLAMGAAQAEDVKAGFVYVGPVGDHGWTYRHDKGRL
ncbi:MAG: BMP family ABC transporter substrate-binding protein, partial [Gammaproteobacteria bacterium]|nr:BMP family ABC transporter substrate-binding protein [Gammaproteobacteria bacterium]